MSQASLWTDALYLEGVGTFQVVRMVFCCGAQSGTTGAIKAGLIVATMCVGCDEPGCSGVLLRTVGRSTAVLAK